MSDSDSMNIENEMAVKLVRYCRTKLIGNEPQFLVTTLSALTCYAPRAKEFTSCIIMGESSSGKTALNKCITGEDDPSQAEEKPGLLPREHVKHMTTGSPKAMIYSSDLIDDDSEIRLINFAELNKLEQEHIEFMKGLSGDDNAFVYEKVDATSNSTKVITQKKRNYILTYAQVNVLDKELQTRLLMVPVEENRLINQCVVDMNFGAEEVSYKGRSYGAVEDGEKLEREIQTRITAISTSDDDFEVRIPFTTALRGLVNIERPESKRHSQMIANLLKSSARLNFMNRDEDDDGNIFVAAQDIVNVLAAYDLLQSTMTGIDIVDLGIYNYLAGVNATMTNTTTEPKEPWQIIRKVNELGFTEMTQTELDRRLKRLIDENYILKYKDEDKFKYTVNLYKTILTPTVDWYMVREIDDSPVVDPVSEKMYEDIVEYGEELDELKRSKPLKNAVIGNLDPESREAKIRLGVAQLLSGDGMYNELSDIEKDVKTRLGLAKGLDGHQEVRDIVTSMQEDGVIEFDTNKHMYLLRDPSLMGNSGSDSRGKPNVRNDTKGLEQYASASGET